jgi:Calcineurin-like phosphoesterase
MHSKPSYGRSLSRAILGSLFFVATLGVTPFAAAQSADPVIFSFATVGDSRTDPNKPDATTLLANSNPTSQGGAPSLTGTILPQDNQWVQNTQAFGTLLSGIQAQAPNLLFFNGDMIFGYGRPILPAAWANGKPNSWNTAQSVSPDTVFEISQYAYWRGLVAPLFLSGTYVIPVPGNHETQCSYSAAPYSAGSPNPNCNTAAQGNLTGKTAYADNENLFRFNMSDLVQDLVSNLRFSNVSGYFATNVTGLTSTTAPQASTNNGPITGDQSYLSFSFDIQAQPGLVLHFVVINTDPSGADSTAPADWLASDLAAAKNRAAGSTIKYFVFGHKAAFTYNYAAATGGNINPPSSNNPGPGGLDANYVATGCPSACVYTEPYRNAFWSVITRYGATYFSGHEHTVNVSQNADPTGTYPGTPYQVIVGSGGSPFDDKLVGTCSAANPPGCTEPKLTQPYDRYYAWALVQVHQSGRVSLQVSGFGDNYGSSSANYGPIQDLSIYDVATLQ